MAYTAQFQTDMEAFFRERSLVMVDNGLLAILFPCRPDGTAASESMQIQMLECLLGHLLMEMVKEVSANSRNSLLKGSGHSILIICALN